MPNVNHSMILRPRGSAGTSATAQTTPMSKSPTGFLDLPIETRSQIYSFFVDFTGKEARAIKKTRENLMLVSRQVHEDWAPMRYRSTTFKVDDVLAPTARKLFDRYGDEWYVSSSKGYCGPQHFHKLFLSTLPYYKLRNIRRLEYNASIWAEDDFEERCSVDPYVDWPAVKKLRMVLNTFANGLQSLERVVLIENPRRERRNEVGYSICLHDYPPNEGLHHERSKKIWSTASRDGKWDGVVREFRGKRSRLNNWLVDREVWIRLQHNPEFYKHRGEMYDYEIKQVRFTFLKPKDSDIIASVDNAIPKINKVSRMECL